MRARLGLAAMLTAAMVIGMPAGVAAARPSVTVDFSKAGGGPMEYDFFHSSGLVLPPEQCAVGGARCFEWFVGWVQGDDALVGSDNRRPIVGKFTHPIDQIMVRVAPGFQYRAKWILSAFDAKGVLVGRTVVVESQDQGLPGASASGYFTISLSGFAPACRFSIKTMLVATSFPSNKNPEFGLASVRYRFASQPNAGKCPTK